MREYALLLHSAIRPNRIVSLRFITLALSLAFRKFDVVGFFFSSLISIVLFAVHIFVGMDIALHAQGHFLVIIIIPMRFAFFFSSSSSPSLNIDFVLHIFCPQLAIVICDGTTQQEKTADIDEIKQTIQKLWKKQSI